MRRICAKARLPAAGGTATGWRRSFWKRSNPEGVTDFFTVVREFLNEYPQRGLVIVVSDFLDDAGCEKALQYLADYGNELMLIQLWADEDRTPPWTGEVRSGGCRKRRPAAYSSG